MKTLQQKIEVMQAFANGEKIECTTLGYSSWAPVNNPVWDWPGTDYRIAMPEPKKVKIITMLGKNGCLTKVLEGSGSHHTYSASNWVRIPELDKEITLP